MGIKNLFSLTLKGSVDDADRFAIKDSTIGAGNTHRNIIASVLQTYILKPLLDATFAFLNGIKLNSSRIVMQELTSATLSTGAGWYTVARSSRGVNRTMSASFSVGDFGNESGILPFDVVFANSSIAKTHSNTGITLRPRGTFSNSSFGIKNARVAKSDSVDDAGCLIQVELTDASAVNKIATLMDKNTANVISELGFTLVEPVLDNTPTLPDGVTSGGSVTFLEAGEELRIDAGGTTTRPIARIDAYASSDDTIRVSLIWNGIQKQGTGLLLSTSSLVFKDQSLNTSVAISGHNISAFGQDKNDVFFFLNQVGIASALTKNVQLMATVFSADTVFTII